MRNDPNLQFIREKISQLGSAIMYNNSQEVIKVPNNLVNAIKVDDEGRLWFTGKKPTAHLEECEQNFPARLHFYRKGLFFYMEVSGKATVVNYSYEDAGEDAVLMKMSLNSIEYNEPEGEKDKNIVEKYITNAYNWILRTVAVNHREPSAFPKMQQ